MGDSDFFLVPTTCFGLEIRKIIFKYPLLSQGHVYSSCVRNVMLYASETWPLTSPDLQRLQRNDRAMIGQICYVKPENVAILSDRRSCWLDLRSMTSMLSLEKKAFLV